MKSQLWLCLLFVVAVFYSLSTGWCLYIIQKTMWHIIVMSVLEAQLKKQLSYNATIHTELLETLWHTDICMGEN